MTDDTIHAIDAEIAKIAARIIALEDENSGDKQDQKIKTATISLLKNVIHDLRKQQKKLKKLGR